MAATAPIPYQDRSAGILRGGVLIDSTRLAALGRTSGVDLTLRDWDGRIAAAARVDPVPHRSAGRSFLQSTVALDAPAYPPATLTARDLDRRGGPDDRGRSGSPPCALGLLGVVIAVVLGVVWSLQISRPVERLARVLGADRARRLGRAARRCSSVRELDTLVAALDRMRRDLRDLSRAARSERAPPALEPDGAPGGARGQEPADADRDLDRRPEAQLRAPARPTSRRSWTRRCATIGEEIETLKRLLHEFSELRALSRSACSRARCRRRSVRRHSRRSTRTRSRTGRLELSAAPGDRGRRRSRAAPPGAGQPDPERARGDADRRTRSGRVRRTATRSRSRVRRSPDPGSPRSSRRNLFVPGFTTKAHAAAGSGSRSSSASSTTTGGTIARRIRARSRHDVPDLGCPRSREV